MDATATAGAARTGFRATLAIPDFRRLAIALVVDATGGWAYGVVLLVYVFDRTHSATWLGATAVVRFLPGLLLSPYAGVIAEKYERTKVMVVSAAACAALMVALALLTVAHAPVAVIVAVSVVSAALYTPFLPAAGALMPQLVGEDQLAAANSITASIDNLTIIVGPGVGGLMLLLPSAAPAFLLNGASYVLAAVYAARIGARSTPTDVTAAGHGIVAQMSVGMRALASTPAALVPVVYAFLATFLYGTDSVLFAPISVHLHGGRSGYGYLLAAQAVGGVAVAAVVSRVSKGGVAWWICGGMLVYTLPTLIIPLLHNLAGGLAVQVVRGVGTVFVDVLAVTALQRAVPRHLLSRVLGLFTGLIYAASALGSLVAPIVLHAVGLTSTLVILSVVVAALSLAGLPALVRVDRDADREIERTRPLVALLSRFEPFADATPTALQQMAGGAEVVSATPGRTIVSEGDPADAFWVVEEGEVSVSSSGAHDVVRVMQAPAFFGEIGLLHHIPRTATVTTTKPTRLLRIGADDFETALAASSVRAGLHAIAGSRLALTQQPHGDTAEQAPVHLS